jgi:hypothetical protein
MKKIISGICALALSLSAFSLVSSAEQPSFTVTLGSGTTTQGVGTKGRQYVSVYAEGLSDTTIMAGQLWISVLAGTADGSKAANYKLTANLGLSCYDDDSEEDVYPSYLINYINDGDNGDVVPGDGYDTISIPFSGIYPFTNEDDLVCEFYLTPVDTSQDIELKVAKAQFTPCTLEMAELPTIKLGAGDTTYLVGAGTSVVTEKATATAEPTAEPTAVPTATPTVAPTAEPTAEPTAVPTVAPTAEPTAEPTAAPVAGDRVGEKLTDEYGQVSHAFKYSIKTVLGTQLELRAWDKDKTKGAKLRIDNTGIVGNVEFGLIVYGQTGDLLGTSQLAIDDVNSVEVVEVPAE